MNTPVNLFFLAATVFMEAENQSYRGKLAVANVVITTAAQRRQTISRVVLTPWFMSCWNTDSPTRRRLTDAVETQPPAWNEAMKAAASAFYGIEPDPTHGATNYVNEKLLTTNGKLPKWFDRNKVTVVIGDHTFLKLI